MEEKVIKSMLKEGKPVSIHTVADNLHEQELIVLGLIIKMLKKRLIRQMPSIPLSESPEHRISEPLSFRFPVPERNVQGG